MAETFPGRPVPWSNKMLSIKIICWCVTAAGFTEIMRRLLHLRTHPVRAHFIQFLIYEGRFFPPILSPLIERTKNPGPTVPGPIKSSKAKGRFLPIHCWDLAKPVGPFDCVRRAEGGSEGGQGAGLALPAVLPRTCLDVKALLKSWGSREVHLGCVWV